MALIWPFIGVSMFIVQVHWETEPFESIELMFIFQLSQNSELIKLVELYSDDGNEMGDAFKWQATQFSVCALFRCPRGQTSFCQSYT